MKKISREKLNIIIKNGQQQLFKEFLKNVYH